MSGQLVGERNGSTVVRSYVYGRELAAMYAGSTPQYLSTDEVGSVTVSRNAGATPQRTFTYEPYGKIKAQTAASGAPALPVMYAGGLTLDQGTSYQFGGRRYSSANLTFNTVDQGGTGEAYSYASGNPIQLADPTGLFSWSNFLQDVNQISGYVASGAQIVAMGCAATIVCAPAAPFIEGVAGVGAAVNLGSGVILGAQACAKGSCSGLIADLAFSLVGARFASGKLPGGAGRGAGTAANGAGDALNGVRLGQQLARESAHSVFTSSGRLSSGAIADSREIISGSRLGNKDLIQRLTSDGSNIADWGKYTTRTHQSPSGDFQVHFYMNRSTGAIDYGYDYKVIFNGAR